MTDVDEAGIPTIAPRALTIHAVEPVGVAWSRDGKSLLFTMGAPGPLRLWRLRVDPLRAAERIEIAGDWVRHPATAATRDRLAFSQVTWDSHLYRFDAGHSVEEVAPSSSFESDPHFSPDGRRLAFVSGRSGHVQIWVAAADGSNPRQLTHNVRQWSGSPSWSPDGRSIAFDSGGIGEPVRIWTVDADGGTPRQNERARKPVGMVPRREMDLLRPRSRSDARYLAHARGGRAAPPGVADWQGLRGI